MFTTIFAALTYQNIAEM